jgi:hypothetical protein
MASFPFVSAVFSVGEAVVVLHKDRQGNMFAVKLAGGGAGAAPVIVSFGQVSRKLHVVAAYLQREAGAADGRPFEFEVLAKGPGGKAHGIGPTCIPE